MSTAEFSDAPSSPTVVLPASVLPTDWTLDQLQQHLGGIPLERIRLYPPPGMATRSHLEHLVDDKFCLCELIDGTLVEKPVGWYEATLAQIIGGFLQAYLAQHKVGLGLGADAALRILGDQIRLPDVCFISKERVQQARPQRGETPAMAPNLAIEVLSASNTTAEMDRKLKEYFEAGAEMVWYIDPQTRSATVYTSVDESQHVKEQGTLTGGDVLPGFELSLAEPFAQADEQADMLQDGSES